LTETQNKLAYLVEMAQNGDDFFLPHDPDAYEPCADDSNIQQGEVVLPLGAALSLLCYVYLLWMYFGLQSPVFRRHPTSKSPVLRRYSFLPNSDFNTSFNVALAVYKCIIELIFITQYLWVPFIDNQKFYDDDLGSSPYLCHSSVHAGYLAFVTQFALVGSELCFLVISYDLRLAYTNPFSSYKENASWFFWSVISGSLVTAFALMCMGPRVYGMSDLGLVWIQKRREDGSPNYPKGVLYYIITVIVYLYSLWANFRFSLDSEKGFSKTVSNRLSIMRRSKRFTVGYVAYGSVVFLMEFISYATKSRSAVVNNAPAYLLAFRGVWGLAVILYSNYAELTWELLNPFRLRLKPQDGLKEEDVALEKLLLQPHLNTALRAEILYFTTQGIMFAAKDHFRRTQARRAGNGALGNSPRTNRGVPGGAGGHHGVEDDSEEDHEYTINGDAEGTNAK
jgi:hypothetical protein